MVKDKAIFREIITEVMEAKKSLDLDSDEKIIYPPNISLAGPMAINLPKEEKKQEVINKLMEKIDLLVENEYKIILLYESQKLAIPVYLGTLLGKRKDTVSVHMTALLGDIGFTREHATESKKKGTKTIADFQREISRRVNAEQQKMGNQSVSFPMEFKEDLTVEECKEYLLKEIEKMTKERGLDEQPKVVIIAELDNVMGGTHLTTEDEITFLKAIIELSKDFTIIAKHPKVSYGRMCPASIMNRIQPISLMLAPITAYNTASLETLPIIKELMEKAAVVQTGR